jgi:cyclophilin family peptidyl-prolyl cis-trans isomerase
MANKGPNTNGSQFFMYGESLIIFLKKIFFSLRFRTTAKAPHLDGKHVVFGHVVSGQEIVDVIEELPVDSNTNRPLKDVIISQCGDLEYATSKLMNFFKSSPIRIDFSFRIE